MIKHVLRAILILALGICLLVWPAVANELIVKAIGCVLIALGLITIIYTLSTKEVVSSKGITVLNFTSAALFIIIGILLIAKAQAFLKFIDYFLGVILLVFGIVQTVHAYHFTKGGTTGDKASMLVIPLLIALVGIIFLFRVISLNNMVTVVFGVCLILLGISELALDLKSLKIKRALNAAKVAEDINKQNEEEEEKEEKTEAAPAEEPSSSAEED